MKKTFLLSLIMAVTMPAIAQKDSFQEFAFRLFDKVEAKSKTPNCVMSPYSAQIALSLLANGLSEEAATELKSMMGVEDYSMQQLNEYLHQSINKKQPDANELEECEYYGFDSGAVPSVEVANAVFLNNCLIPNADFSEICSNYYEGIVENIDFSDPMAGDYIDNWANEKTHGTIPKLNLPISDETMIVLANAVYFHGGWVEPFYKISIPKAFNNADGSISYVSMMGNFFSSQGAVMPEKNVIAAQLPYGLYGNYRMTLFMPMEQGDEIMFDHNLWKEAKENMNNYALNVQMPLFNLDNDYELNDVLKELGATKMFECESITGIADKNKTLTDTKQLAHISVDENGTTASAVTVLVANDGIPAGEKLDFIVDRPFYFTIDHQGEILFIGHVSNLSSENVEAITNVVAKPLNDACYNLQGQRVVESQRGIVVKNGRKYINR